MIQRVLSEPGRRTPISAVASDEQYAGAVVRCKIAAKSRGHILGVWYPVSAQLHMSICEDCGAMVWGTRSGNEEHWRVGGTVLKEDCPE